MAALLGIMRNNWNSEIASSFLPLAKTCLSFSLSPKLARSSYRTKTTYDLLCICRFKKCLYSERFVILRNTHPYESYEDADTRTAIRGIPFAPSMTLSVVGDRISTLFLYGYVVLLIPHVANFVDGPTVCTITFSRHSSVSSTDFFR